MNYYLAPSILSADFMRLGEQIAEVEKAKADYLHVDVMDGMFVPNISFGMPVLASIQNKTKLVLDVHLMIQKPDRYLETFAKLGADILTVHLETLDNPVDTLEKIKKLGMKPSISISPETEAKKVFPYLEYVSQVLVMTVHPGVGGQVYLDECTEKIKAVREEIERRKLDVDVEVDGGINTKTIKTVLDAGANVMVMGSSVFNDNPYESACMYIDILKNYNK